MKARRDAAIAIAHRTAAFLGAAQCGKLEPLERYLSRTRDRIQAPADILRGFDRFAETHNQFVKARDNG